MTIAVDPIATMSGKTTNFTGSSEASINETTIIQIDPIATIGNMQKCLLNYEKALCEDKRDYVIDISKCVFIEPASLLFLLAFLTKRSSKKWSTTLNLPKNKGVRDFLRIWNFPEAIYSATHRPLFRSVIEDNRKYFGENTTVADVKYAGRLLDNGHDRLLSDRFFGIKTFVLSQQSRARKVTDESKRWETVLVKSILSRYLPGPSSYVASRLVFESMTNAIRHPGADVIQTTSLLQQPDKSANISEGFFTLSFWDNGVSMVDTLRDAINRGKSVQSKPMAKFYCDYEVIEEAPFNKRTSSIISSSFLPDKTTSDVILFVSTTFPGITRDIAGQGHEVHKDIEEEDEPALRSPGMGLFILLNAAIDVYGGSVSFRTKNLFMNIKKSNTAETKYRAKVQRFDDSISFFPGNMLTIRIPIVSVST